MTLFWGLSMRKLIWEQPVTPQSVSSLLPRAEQNSDSVKDLVQELINEVAIDGLSGIRNQTLRFDGVEVVDTRVPRLAMQKALENLDPSLRAAIEEAISRVRKFSELSVPPVIRTSIGSEANLEMRFQPIESVGVYVPGGKAVYPSSVVMNVVPAQVAGVKRIALCSPPQKQYGGLPDPAVLATAELLGIDEVYAIGGAGAVAAMALGVEEMALEPVQMVTGPGNVFVATAKRMLRDKIAIDSEAGPTEILIIADETANPSWIAADLISQAEHDENAAAVLLTTSLSLLESVASEIDKQAAKTFNRERVLSALESQQSALVLVDSLETAVAIANEYATEHLEIQTANPREILKDISNAGAIFLGSFSPVSLGDYLAGSNHVLPTSGQAKRSSGLSVYSFLRPQQIVDYGSSGLEMVAGMLETFANAEGLPGHGDAARIRFRD